MESLPITGKSGLETLKVCKLGIRKALGPLLLAILDDAHVHDVAVIKELGDGFDGRVVGQIAKMGGERRLVGQGLGQVVAERVVALQGITLISSVCNEYGRHDIPLSLPPPPYVLPPYELVPMRRSEGGSAWVPGR